MFIKHYLCTTKCTGNEGELHQEDGFSFPGQVNPDSYCPGVSMSFFPPPSHPFLRVPSTHILGRDGGTYLSPE